MASGAGTEIDDVIGPADRLLVVFDHEYGVTQIAQRFEGSNEPIVVAMMQSNRRFVEHVQHAAQLRADLCRQPDPLAFAAR